jgi:hypothetical protein
MNNGYMAGSQLFKRGQRVHFKPPEGTYSLSSIQHAITGSFGNVMSSKDERVQVRFDDGRMVTVNGLYLYAE